MAQRTATKSSHTLLARLARNEKGLTTVDLRAFDTPTRSLGNAFWFDMGEALSLNTELKTLTLRHSDIGPTGVRSLVRGIVATADDANVKGHGGKRSDDANVKGHGGKRLLSTPPPRGRLELDLRACGLLDDGAAAVAELICASRGGTPILASLDLWDNGIGADGAASLGGALCSPLSWGLHALNMGQNVLQDRGGSALAAGIEGHRGLATLSLMKNSLYDDSCGALGRALASPDCALRSLCLRNNGIGDRGAEALAEALAHGICSNAGDEDSRNDGSSDSGRADTNSSGGTRTGPAICSGGSGVSSLLAQLAHGTSDSRSGSSKNGSAVNPNSSILGRGGSDDRDGDDDTPTGPGPGTGTGAVTTIGTIAKSEGGATSLLESLDMRSNEVGKRGLDALCNAVERPSNSLQTVDLRKQSHSPVNTAYSRGEGWTDREDSTPLYDLDAEEPMGWSAR